MATFEEICFAARHGQLPVVRHTPSGRSGEVTVIKNQKSSTHRGKGIAVNFGASYDEWFWDNDGHDKRKKYMREIEVM